MSRKWTWMISGLLILAASDVALGQATPLKIGQEQPPANEAAAIEGLVKHQLEQGKRLLDKRNRRVQHTKGHACVEAQFVVGEDVPEAYRHGVFAAPKTYRAVIRFSNGRESDDAKSDVHGMAIKLFDVRGPRLLDVRPDAEQDFVTVDAPSFFAPDVQTTLDAALYLDKLRMGDKTPPSPEVARALAKVKARGSTPGSPIHTYHSAVPYRLGPNAVKYLVEPVKPLPPTTSLGENDMREALAASLNEGSVEFRFSVRPQIDVGSEKIEDATSEWNTPPVVLAKIVIPKQDGFLTAEAQAKCENLSFMPWNGIEPHQPLGGINRARREVYVRCSDLRRAPADK